MALADVNEDPRRAVFRAAASAASTTDPTTAVRDVAACAAAMVRRALVLLPPSRTFACRAGCSSCCTLDPDVTATELRAVLDETDRQGTTATVRARMGRELCPLLTDDGLCSVYDVRPLACRAHVSYDAETCAERGARGLRGADAWPPARVLYESAWTALHAADVRRGESARRTLREGLRAAL